MISQFQPTQWKIHFELLTAESGGILDPFSQSSDRLKRRIAGLLHDDSIHTSTHNPKAICETRFTEIRASYFVPEFK